MSDVTSGPEVKVESIESAGVLLKKPRKKFHGHPALGRFVNLLLRMPMVLQLPIYVFLFLFYSPPVVLNLLSCVRAMNKRSASLRVISGPEYIFVFPMIAWGFVGCLLSHFNVIPDPVISWAYLCLVLFTFVTIGLDFKSSGWFGAAVVIIALLALLGWWASTQQIPVLQLLGTFFAWFHLGDFPEELVFAMSSFLLLVYLVVFIDMNIHNVLLIKGNYVEVYSWMAKTYKNTRASFAIEPGTDDVNEFWLGFSIPIHLRGKGAKIQSHLFSNVPAGPVVEEVLTAMLNAQEVASTDDFHDYDGGEDDES